MQNGVAVLLNKYSRIRESLLNLDICCAMRHFYIAHANMPHKMHTDHRKSVIFNVFNACAVLLISAAFDLLLNKLIYSRSFLFSIFYSVCDQKLNANRSTYEFLD